MKHFRKVCAVLLAAVMVAVILPSTGLLTSETTTNTLLSQSARISRRHFFISLRGKTISSMFIGSTDP